MQVIVFTIYVIVRANSTDIDYVEEAFMHTPRTNANNIIHYRNDSDFYFSYGVKAFKGKRFDRAEKWLKRAIEARSEEHTSELQSRGHLVCRLLLEKKKNNN